MEEIIAGGSKEVRLGPSPRRDDQAQENNSLFASKQACVESTAKDTPTKCQNCRGDIDKPWKSLLLICLHEVQIPDEEEGNSAPMMRNRRVQRKERGDWDQDLLSVAKSTGCTVR